MNPNYATAHQWYATALAAQGRTREALDEIRRAAEIDPLSPAIGVTLGIILFLAGEDDAAIARLDKTRDIAPDFFTVHVWLALVHGQLGNADEAIHAAEGSAEIDERVGANIRALSNALVGRRAEAERYADQIAKRRNVPFAVLAVVYSALGDTQRALDYLEREFDQEGWSFFTLHRNFLLYLNVVPWFEPLRSEPRFRALVIRLNLPA